MKTCAIPLSVSAVCALLLWAGVSGPVVAAPISENEAIAIAEYWYANEISSPNTALAISEKATRLGNRNRHQVQSILGRDKLQAKRQPNDSVVAYVVTFEPSGYVLVSGEDSVNPVLAFNAT